MTRSPNKHRRERRASLQLPAQRVLLGLVEPMELVEGGRQSVVFRLTRGRLFRIGELVQVRIELPQRVICMYAVPSHFVDCDGGRGIACSIFLLRADDRDEWNAFVDRLLDAAAA